MKNLYNIKLLLLVCLMLSCVGFLTSCNDDDESTPNNGQVTLLSFGPTGAKHGEQIQFIGLNLDKVESIELPGATVTKAQFIDQTSEKITLVIPDEAIAGKVTLKSSAGDVTSKTVLSFEVPVIITAITPEARPLANITITGSKLNWVEGIIFGESKDTITTFVSQSLTELVVTVPEDAKTGKLTFLTGGTEPLAIETENQLLITLPKVTTLSPNTLRHGDNLTLTGTDLDLIQEVIFNGVGPATISSFVSQTPTELVVTVPDNAVKGTLSLVAKKSLVVVPTNLELTFILPTISAIAPNPVDPGANITITGTDLDLVKSVVFTGGSAVSTFVSQAATQLVVTVPNNALKGALTLITKRNFSVPTMLELQLKGALPPLPVLPYALYDDARKAGWDDWGWGGASVWNSKEIVRQGEFAVKKTYDGSYDALRFHTGTAVATAGYTELTFSTFGTPGTGGKTINIITNEAWGAPYKFQIVEGEWKTYTIKLTDLGNPANISDILFQSDGWAGVVHYDHIGLR